VADSVVGPTSDLKLLDQSGLLKALPEDIAALGDLAYVGSHKLHPKGLAPRRKPRGKPRPPEDRVYNTWFAKQRIIVEHSIGRLRTWLSTQGARST